jgi:hypothetical protein
MKENNNILYFNLLVITVVSSVLYIDNLKLKQQLNNQNTEINNIKSNIYLKMDTIIKDNNNLKEKIQATNTKQQSLIYTMNELGKITVYMKELNIRVNGLSEKGIYSNSINRRLTDLESNDILLENKLQVSTRFLEKNILDNTNNKIGDVTKNLHEIIEKIKIQGENLNISNQKLEKNILDITDKKINAVAIDLNKIIEKIKSQEEKLKKHHNLNNNPRTKKEKHFNQVFLRNYLLDNK